MKIELVRIDSIKPDPDNVRLHSDKNLEAIKGSLREFGQQKPIVVDAKNEVVAGNGTLEAALALGWTKIAIVRTSLKGVQKRAYAIADNRTSDLSEFDNIKLSEQLQSLVGESKFDLESIGYTAVDFDKLLKEVNAEEQRANKADEAPEPPKRAITKPGDLITLGDHRLLCGDSTQADVVKRLMGG